MTSLVRSATSAILFLSESDVRRCLPISAAIEANRVALGSLRRDGRGGGVVPKRIGLQYDHPGGSAGADAAQDWTLFKPAAYYPPTAPTSPGPAGGDDGRGRDDGGEVLMGMKLVSVRSRNPSAFGKSTVPATVLLLDAATGEVNAVMGGTYLTAARTAAGSALATELCLGARGWTKAHTDVTVFGAGLQAEMHIRALQEVLGNGLGKVTVVNRSAGRAERLCAKLQGEARHSDEGAGNHDEGAIGGMDMDIVLLNDSDSVRRAVARSDVVCTTTNSASPLFTSEWVRPGTHVNGVGSYTPLMEEVDSDFVAGRCHVLVDTLEALEVGDLRRMSEDSENFVGLLGDVLCGEATMPTFPPEDGGQLDCTMFKSVGTAIQDVVTARTAVEVARREGIGTDLDMS